jgi:membrane protease YdiL (CAAX protease family)
MNGVSLASIVGLLLALGLIPALAFYKNGSKAEPINQSRVLLITWGGCLSLVALMLLWEARPLSSIGIVWGNYTAWAIGALLGGTISAISGASVYFSLRAGKPIVGEGAEQGLTRLISTPLWFRCACVLTAGITEEIVFRGYAIERLRELTGSPWLAVAIPLAVFVLAHLSAWSAGHLAGVFVAGGLLTGLYVWRQDLVACMIAHALMDAPLIFLPVLIKTYAAGLGQGPAATRAENCR